MNYYDEEERRKLNELLSSGAISSDGAINGIPNQTLAALMADNSEQGVQFNPTFQQGEMDRNREQFAREDVRAAERGYNPQQFQTPQAPAQPAAPAAPQPQNWIQRSGGEKISLDQFAGNRPHDPFRDGPEILGRQRTPDGGEMIIKRVAGLDGFGRQSARVVQEFVPPPDMGRMKQAAEIQKLQAETRKADRIESPKADWGTVESGGKMYRINKATGEITPATVDGTQLFGKKGDTAQAKEDGAKDVDVSIAALRNAYDRLESGGGITSTAKSPYENIKASISSSDIGQMAGRAVGSEMQSARNDVLMTRPALLAALMKATGMSAKQMDSNAELKLWLSTATDPTLDVESNRKALGAIEKKYLSGDRGVEAPTSAFDAAKEARYQEWKRNQGVR